MSVVGLWDKGTVEASYQLSASSIIGAVLVAMVLGVLVVTLGRERKAILLLILGTTTLTVAAYVFLVRCFAESLCVEAPLDVKAQGMVMVPFFLGTKGAGLSILGVLFLLGNIVMLSVYKGRNTLFYLLPNCVLLCLLVLMAVGAYWAACMGYGIPLAGLRLSGRWGQTIYF